MTTVILCVLLALNIIATCILAAKVRKTDRTALENATAHYTVYVGTNDKRTYSQKISADEAKSIIDGICTKYVNGFTIHDAVGTWHDEKHVVTHENTIVCYLDDIDEELLHRICDEICEALLQNTVLIQKEYTQLNFYNCKN